MKYIKKFENKEPEKSIEYYDNSNIKSISYKLNGKYHRLDGPAHESWYRNGQKNSEIYIKNSKYHREDGPAIKIWYENGQIEEEAYYINMKYHREDGPANIEWDDDGTKKQELYYLNDNNYNRVDWIKKLKVINSPHYEEQKMIYDMEKNIEKYNL